MSLPRPGFLLITDRRSADRPLLDVVRAALDAGCQWVMLREKDLDSDALVRLGEPIVSACESRSAVLVVNGDVAAARRLGAAGLHLPQGRSVAEARSLLGADAVIGVSSHDIAQARAAERDGADYATLSPIYLTESKPGYGPALGTRGLSAVAASVAIPLVALGGVTPDRAGECLSAGAASVAAMGTVMRARDPGACVAAFLAALSGGPRACGGAVA